MTLVSPSSRACEHHRRRGRASVVGVGVDVIMMVFDVLYK
jgi:hypothetical protein